METSSPPEPKRQRTGFTINSPSLSKYETHGGEFAEFIKKELENPSKRTTLYDYQIQAVLNTRDYFIRHGTKPQVAALIVAPCGAGKSGMVSMLPYVLKSRKVLILTPSLQISEQLERAFGRGKGGMKKSFFWVSKIFDDEVHLANFLENGRRIKECKEFLNTELDRLVIVNAQKFGGQAGVSLVHKNKEIVHNAKEAFKSFDTLIVDEAHHYPAETWKNIVEEFPDKKIIFLTATPFRRGSKGEKVNILGPLQQITHEIKKETVRGKTVRHMEFAEFPTDDLYERRKTVLNNSDKLQRIGTEIRAILTRHDTEHPAVKHKAMVIVTTKDEAQFCAAWLGGAIYHTSDKATDCHKADFEDPMGSLQILVTCGKLLEGYDKHFISVCVILRNVGSSQMFSQFIGRGTRRSGPDDPIVACVRSLPCFDQQKMWDEYETTVAERDPEEADDEEEVDEDEEVDMAAGNGAENGNSVIGIN